MLYNLRYVALGIVGPLIAVGSVALAQDTPPTPPREQADEHRGMNMQGHDGMTRMMDNCNRMMESFLRKAPRTPDAPAQPGPAPKG